MGDHQQYADNLLQKLLGQRWDPHNSKCVLGEGGINARLDGVVISSNSRTTIECAVEIEARVYKQIRGALVDLALHDAPKKLLIVMLAQKPVNDSQKTENHIWHVWKKLCPGQQKNFDVVVLGGTYRNPDEDGDVDRLSQGLARLGLLDAHAEEELQTTTDLMEHTSGPKQKKDYVQALERKFHEAESQGKQFIEIRAGDLHRELGGPNRMPTCCSAMEELKQRGDAYLYQPPKGKGSNLRIRYWLPR